MTNASNTPANWYPDPSGRHEQRYWNGTAWTQDVANGGVDSTEQLSSRGKPERVYDVPGSILLVGGLRKYLLWGPIVAGVGIGILNGGLYTEDPSGWLVLGGLIAIVGAIISIAGILQLIKGVWTLAPLFEVAAQASLSQKSAPCQSWPAPRSAPSQEPPKMSAPNAHRTEATPPRITLPRTPLPRPSDRRR